MPARTPGSEGDIISGDSSKRHDGSPRCLCLEGTSARSNGAETRRKGVRRLWCSGRCDHFARGERVEVGALCMPVCVCV